MEKKARIITAAIDLFYESGLSIPASKIAKHAGVSNGTLFNYFETKQLLIDGVYYSIAAKTFDVLKESFKGDILKEQLFSAWISLAEHSMADPKSFYVSGLIRQSEAFSESTRLATDNLFELIIAQVSQARQKYADPMSTVLLCEIATSQLRAVITYIIRNQLSAEDAHKNLCASFEMYWRGTYYLE